jgi:hypothetical protein
MKAPDMALWAICLSCLPTANRLIYTVAPIAAKWSFLYPGTIKKATQLTPFPLYRQRPGKAGISGKYEKLFFV